MIRASIPPNNRAFPNTNQEATTTSECLRTLQQFIEPGQVTQLVAIEASEPGLRQPQTFAGYFDFDHLCEMAAVAAKYSGNAKGVFFTLNPLLTDVLARCRNRVKIARKGDAASDRDVLCRKWLMIDVDPVRPGGISSSETEKQHAWQCVESVRRHLGSSGLPEPLVADSGNGYHLYYRVDLPADSPIPRHFLSTLSGRFSTALVTIDTSVASASQLTKIFGTLAAKGDSTSDRPHRLSCIIDAPSSVQTVGPLTLTGLISPEQTHAPPAPPRSETNALVFARAAAYLRQMSPSVSGQKGHNQLFEAACRLVQGFGLSKEDALPILREYNERAEPPWDEEDLVHKLEDADSQSVEVERGYLLHKLRYGATPQPSSKAPSCDLPQLSGPRYPVSIPDLIPAPRDAALALLNVGDIERPPGRPRFEGRYYAHWQAYNAVFQQHRSCVSIPDCVMASGVGGAVPRTGWTNRIPFPTDKMAKREQRALYKGLRDSIPQLENVISDESEQGNSELIQRVESMTQRFNALQLRVSSETCPAHCPLHGSDQRHAHYIFRPNGNVLGSLMNLRVDNDNGIDGFNFDGLDDQGRVILKKLIKENAVVWSYLPVQMFGQAAGMSIRQIRIFQGLFREKTRESPRLRSRAKTADYLIKNGEVPARRGRGDSVCPLLDAEQDYVAFGGNLGDHCGRGYRLVGTTGWLPRCGFPIEQNLDTERMWNWTGVLLDDLQKLSEWFDFVVAGLDTNGSWRSLAELCEMVRSRQCPSRLGKCSLRVFAPSDYLTRWRFWFADRLGYSFIPGGTWSEQTLNVAPERSRPAPETLKARMRLCRITGKQVARLLGWDPSKVSRQLNNRAKMSEELLRAVGQLCENAQRIAT